MRSDEAAKGLNIEAEIAKVERLRDEKMRQIYASLTPWNEVQVARHQERPYTLDYIGLLCEDFTELHGDRINADDGAIVGGLARFAGRVGGGLGASEGARPENAAASQFRQRPPRRLPQGIANNADGGEIPQAAADLH